MPQKKHLCTTCAGIYIKAISHFLHALQAVQPKKPQHYLLVGGMSFGHHRPQALYLSVFGLVRVDPICSWQGPPRRKGLAALKARLKTYYQTHKVQSKFNLKKVTLNWIKRKTAVKLRAKAAQANALVGFTAGLAKEFQAFDGPAGYHKHKCVQSMAAMCSLARQDVFTEQDFMDWRRYSAEHMFH